MYSSSTDCRCDEFWKFAVKIAHRHQRQDRYTSNSCACTSMGALPLVPLMTSRLVDLAIHCNANHHRTQRSSLEDGLNLFRFNIA